MRSAGGNDVRVGGIGLRVADAERLLARSRDAAVEEATAKAQEYADATGQTLADVLSLREVHATAVVPQALRFDRAAMGPASALPSVLAPTLAVTVDGRGTSNGHHLASLDFVKRDWPLLRNPGGCRKRCVAIPPA